MVKVAGSGSSLVFRGDDLLSDQSCIDVSDGSIAISARSMMSASLHGINCSGGSLDVDGFQITSGAGNGILFSGGTARVRAFEISASSGEAVKYNSSGNAPLIIQGARLVSTWTHATLGRAVYASAGTGGMRLHNCVLIGSGSGLNESINATNGNFVVQFHGTCTANKPKGTNVIGVSGLTESPTSLVYGTGIT